ncbi:MAG: GGDEF domain-containing protein [Gammaproteobacteria bacterium]|nr:GGDEF domain-containing protein [Gammaproteobacteria bacterium]MDH3562503.1 GGDEF domain-containing protein [Gammaproteobacteria bacterium]
MSAVEHHALEPGLIPALARHLEHLKDNPDGVELFELIQKALVHCRQHNYINVSCIVYLHAMLQEYTKNHKRPSAVRIRARLIQQYLAIYLPRLGKTGSTTTATDAKSILLRASPAPGMPAHAKSTSTNSTPNRHTPSETKNATVGATANVGQNKMERDASTKEVPPAEPSGHRHSTQIQDGHPAPNMNHVEILLREREALSQQLTDANAYLKLIEAEREQLRTELNKLRRSARTNEQSLTKLGLPKRHVLLRQIQAEIERVNRHGNPLALALIDVDDLEKLTHQLGQDVTKAVLDHYSSEILGNFRSYDLVARYNKDEFAVLLPNTDKAEAARALEKIRKRASESHFSHKGHRHPLPGFGGVLTFYSPGEEPDQMLGRADEALINLKLRGERQLVVV